jgi:hypothetical protein
VEQLILGGAILDGAILGWRDFGVRRFWVAQRFSAANHDLILKRLYRVLKNSYALHREIG